MLLLLLVLCLHVGVVVGVRLHNLWVASLGGGYVVVLCIRRRRRRLLVLMMRVLLVHSLRVALHRCVLLLGSVVIRRIRILRGVACRPGQRRQRDLRRNPGVIMSPKGTGKKTA
jgi:hypothetical protein